VTRPGWVRALDVAAVLVCAALFARLFASVPAPPPPAWWPVLALAALAGVAAADLASGLVHFACDRFGSEATPVLGPALIRPFREHHRDPRGIVRHGFWEVNGNNALAVAPLLWALADAAPAASDSLVGAARLAAAAAFVVAVAATNAVHRAAHAAPSRGPWRALQRAGLALVPAAHARHHRRPHDRSYCITTGWWNPLLDRVRFWERAERALRYGHSLAGAAARR
jgi:ubiquitin-conjugating enzyme E2 variant